MFPLLVPVKLLAALVLFPLSITRVVVAVSVVAEPAAVLGAGDVGELAGAGAEDGFGVAAGALLDAVLAVVVPTAGALLDAVPAVVVPTNDNDAAGLDAELDAQPATQLATDRSASNLLTALPLSRKLTSGSVIPIGGKVRGGQY
jgi:hypothetical protein